MVIKVANVKQLADHIRIKRKAKPTVGVVGLGKLGLPLLSVIAECGFDVCGLDQNSHLIELLKQKKFRSVEPKLNDFLSANEIRISYTSNYNDTSHCDIFFIIVPTPSDNENKFINDFILSALHNLLDSFQNSNSKSNKTIVIVSTVMPGSCEKIFQPLIDEWHNQNKSVVKVSLLYSPEFIALGTVIKNLQYPDMVLIGAKPDADLSLFNQIMNKVVKTRPPYKILTQTEAEIVKILVNCFVTMKISFANFIGEISDFFENVNANEIAKALAFDTRIGHKYLTPGMGFAGPCFPRDNKALISMCEENGLVANLAIATDQINERQPEKMIKRLFSSNKSLKSVGFFGITYKSDSNVIEESQQIKIMEILLKQDISVNFFDPLISSIEIEGGTIHAVKNQKELLNNEVVLVPQSFEHFLDKDFIKSQKVMIL